MTLEDLSSARPTTEERVVVKKEPEPSPVREEVSEVTIEEPVHVKAVAVQKATTVDKPGKSRMSLVERQSLMNSRPPSSITDNRKRRTSSLHKSIPTQPTSTSTTTSTTTLASTTSPDIFRFPSESPPKQPKPVSRPTHPPPVRPLLPEDKENSLSSYVTSTGRERRKTFNMTMEKLAQMTREENQADKDWEANLANKRRRQSVAI